MIPHLKSVQFLVKIQDLNSTVQRGLNVSSSKVVTWSVALCSDAQRWCRQKFMIFKL